MGYELKCPKCGGRDTVCTVKGWRVSIDPEYGVLEVRGDEIEDSKFGICTRCSHRAKLKRFVTTNR